MPQDLYSSYVFYQKNIMLILQLDLRDVARIQRGGAVLEHDGDAVPSLDGQAVGGQQQLGLAGGHGP